MQGANRKGEWLQSCFVHVLRTVVLLAVRTEIHTVSLRCVQCDYGMSWHGKFTAVPLLQTEGKGNLRDAIVPLNNFGYLGCVAVFCITGCALC